MALRLRIVLHLKIRYGARNWKLASHDRPPPTMASSRSPPATGERDAIVAALEQADSAIARAAELLGMGRTTLWRKLEQYGLTSGAS